MGNVVMLDGGMGYRHMRVGTEWHKSISVKWRNQDEWLYDKISQAAVISLEGRVG